MIWKALLHTGLFFYVISETEERGNEQNFDHR